MYVCTSLFSDPRFSFLAIIVVCNYPPPHTHTAPNIYTENEQVGKYEIMDGAPVRGESIPIRLFLAGYDLTPTMRDINKKFSVGYYLNLVLVDEEERRYFKQQVIGRGVARALLLVMVGCG